MPEQISKATKDVLSKLKNVMGDPGKTKKIKVKSNLNQDDGKTLKLNAEAPENLDDKLIEDSLSSPAKIEESLENQEPLPPEEPAHENDNPKSSIETEFTLEDDTIEAIEAKDHKPSDINDHHDDEQADILERNWQAAVQEELKDVIQFNDGIDNFDSVDLDQDFGIDKINNVKAVMDLDSKKKSAEVIESPAENDDDANTQNEAQIELHDEDEAVTQEQASTNDAITDKPEEDQQSELTDDANTQNEAQIELHDEGEAVTQEQASTNVSITDKPEEDQQNELTDDANTQNEAQIELHDEGEAVTQEQASTNDAITDKPEEDQQSELTGNQDDSIPKQIEISTDNITEIITKPTPINIHKTDLDHLENPITHDDSDEIKLNFDADPKNDLAEFNKLLDEVKDSYFDKFNVEKDASKFSQNNNFTDSSKKINYKNKVKQMHNSSNKVMSDSTYNRAKNIIDSFRNQINDNAPEETVNSETVPANNNGLEDFVSSLLKPMLKEWLDENLSQMVEEIVTKEVKKLTEEKE